MSRIIIIGAGAGGMMAGIHAALCGHQVLILEKNEKAGKKLFITGKGRCNLTNDCREQDFFKAVVSNPRFLYSAFSSWTCQDTMNFFEELGVPLKVERGGRVFPVSDHSSDIIRALERKLRETGAEIRLNTEVQDLIVKDGQAAGVVLKNGRKEAADAVILASGGCSYPSTGSTGDGYRLAGKYGHSIVSPVPSLVPIITEEEYTSGLQGLSLKNVRLKLRKDGRVLYQDFGEMMFTHNGITGPMVLSATAHAGPEMLKGGVKGSIDLKPALTDEQLDQRILREFEASPNRNFKNVIGVLFPSSLTPVMVELSGIDPSVPVHQITRQQRRAFEELVRNLPFTVAGLGEFNEAVITKGGVSVKEVNPKTMESRMLKGLYFAGEVLDLDAVTGGFNLQIAWATGHLAGISVNTQPPGSGPVQKGYN